MVFVWLLETLRALKIVLFGIWCQFNAFVSMCLLWCLRGTLDNDGEGVGVQGEPLKELLWERGVLSQGSGSGCWGSEGGGAGGWVLSGRGRVLGSMWAGEVLPRRLRSAPHGFLDPGVVFAQVGVDAGVTRLGTALHPPGHETLELPSAH